MRDNPDGSGTILFNPTLHTLNKYESVPQNESFMDDGSHPDSNVRQILQAMSDAAWEIGIKPKGLEGHTDELKAVRYHLEDMRTLAKVK
jgi:hypothetical protein